MSSLSHLLAQHRDQQLPQIALQSKVSLLHPLATLPETRVLLVDARRSFEVLLNRGHRSLQPFSDLFEDLPARRRSFLSATEAQTQDAQLTNLLFVLGALSEATDHVSRVLEFLLSAYEIHLYLSAEIAFAFLPQIESDLFARLVGLIPSFPEFLSFFKAFFATQKKSEISYVPRQLVLVEARRSSILLKALMEMYLNQQDISDSHLGILLALLLPVIPGHKEVPILVPAVISFIQGLLTKNAGVEFSLVVTASLAALLGYSRVMALRRQLLKRCDSRLIVSAVAVLADTPEDPLVTRELGKRIDSGELSIDQIWASEKSQQLKARAKVLFPQIFGHCKEPEIAEMEISPVSTDVEMAEGEISESSTDEEMADRPGGPRIMPVEPVKVAAQKSLDISRFFTAGDANEGKTERLLKALLESEISCMSRDLELACEDLEISDDYVRLCLAVMRNVSSAGPGNFLVLRLVEVQGLLVKRRRFPARRLLEKISEEFWFAELVGNKSNHISDFIKLAVLMEDVKIKSRLLQLFRKFDISAEISTVTNDVLDHLHILGNWKWLEILAKSLDFSDKVSVQKIVSAFELARGAQLGQAADCLTALMEISSQKTFLPFFNRLTTRILDALPENFAVTESASDEELLVGSQLLKFLGTFGKLFGAYFSDVKLVRRLLIDVLFNDLIEQEDEIDQAKVAVIVNILSKCNNGIVLEIIKEILIDKKYFNKAVLALGILLQQDTFPIHDQLGVLLVKLVLPEISTASLKTGGNTVPTKWSDIEDFAQVTASAIGDCFEAYALRLTLVQLDAFARQLVNELKDGKVSSSAVRWVLLRTISGVFSAGGEAATLAILPVAAGEILAGLKSREAPIKGKRRAHQGVVSDPVRTVALSALKAAVSSDAEIPAETMAEFVDEATNLVGIEADDILIDTLKELGSKTTDELRKSLAGQVIRNARDKNSAVRLAAAKISAALWKSLGEAMNIAASETLIFASELCEDEDEDVEKAARVLINEIERVTGERISDKF